MEEKCNNKIKSHVRSFCRLKSEELLFFSAMPGTYQIVEKIFFFSKRKHPPDGNLTQFDPSFLIHPSLADHGRTAKNSRSECPAHFLSCLFKKDDCTKLIFLFGNFLVKSCFVGKLPAWSSTTNTYVYTSYPSPKFKN